MKRILMTIGISLFFSVFTISTPVLASLADVDFDRLEQNVLHFKAPAGTAAPTPLKIVFDLRYLGKLNPPMNDALPYLLFTGRPCQSCLQDQALFLIRPVPGRPTSFVYPGKILDPKTGAVLMESRAFVGRCLPNRENVYVVFQKERVDRRKKLQSSVFIAEPGKDHLEEVLLMKRLPDVKTALARVKTKACREIDGRNRKMMPKVFSLQLRKEVDQNQEDEKELEKENSSNDEMAPGSDAE